MAMIEVMARVFLAIAGAVFLSIVGVGWVVINVAAEVARR